jgi:hypothetical protein
MRAGVVIKADGTKKYRVQTANGASPEGDAPFAVETG